MALHVAASAYGHCLAMVGDQEVAARLAVAAVRRGGRTLASVLGHARHAALAHPASAPDPSARITAGATPLEVAGALARARPPLERAVIDLSGRYGLRRAGLGVALRMTPAAAAARVAAVGRTWDGVLDPALLAWMGPGDCEALAGLWSDRDRASVAALLEAGREVAAHVAGCPPCEDRLRAMASVRRLVATAPLPAPPEAVVAAAGGGRTPADALPPPIEAGTRRSRRLLAVAVPAVAAAVGLAGIGAALARRGDGARPAGGAAALGRLPAAGGALQLSPSLVVLPGGDLVVTNRSGPALEWRAEGSAPWLEASPSAGRLRGGAAVAVRVRALASAPEGEVQGWVRVVGADGSTASARLVGTVEHPPDLGAAADGCRVTATAEDESEVALVLHWRAPAGEGRAPMSPVAEGWAATLPAGAGPLTWWVSAVDGRGNQARTADVAVPRGC